MTFEQLSTLINQNNFNSKTDFIIAVKLFDAENDWPEPSTSLSEFILKLENEIGDSIVLHNLLHTIDSYDIAQNSWKIESLTALKEILEIDLQQDLKTIVQSFEERNR